MWYIDSFEIEEILEILSYKLTNKSNDNFRRKRSAGAYGWEYNVLKLGNFSQTDWAFSSQEVLELRRFKTSKFHYRLF